MDSQDMLAGTGTIGSAIIRNQQYGQISPKDSNNRTFYKKHGAANPANKNLVKTLHPTLRRGTEMTKSQANEMVSTEVQVNTTDNITPADIMTPQNHRNGGGAVMLNVNQYSNSGWPQQSQHHIVN